MKDDSRKVIKGDTYISLTNNQEYINDAIKNGAERVIVNDGLYPVDTLIVNDTRKYLIEYLDSKYKDKFKKIKIIGITGTNGKTTSCYLLWQILNKLGYKTGYIGTIGFYIDKKISDLNNTTPDILDLYEMINKCIDSECKYVVMEVSSQALSMNRIGNLRYDYAIFTNLTKDHLDYHKDMYNYAMAKQILFKQVDGKCLINYDDINKHYFILDNNDNLTYGINGGDYHISNYKINSDGSTLTVNDLEHKTNLIGKYNLYNLIISIIILDLENIDYDHNLFMSLEYPPGRMEIINKDTNKIVIDYAHTPDAVNNIINTVREVAIGHIITIIGCGGNRDATKRPEMGQIATELSDYVIFTNDNPRKEDQNKIIDDIVKGVYKNNYQIESNREKAIVKGIQMLEKNDILLVLGKGHEDYQIIGDKKYPFSDKIIILNNI